MQEKRFSFATMGRTSVYVSAIIGFIVVSVALLNWRAVATAREGVQPALMVDTVRVAYQQSYVAKTPYVGVIEPRQQAAVAFQVAGEITELRVEEGDRVTKGQILAMLDVERRRAQLARLEADLARVDANIELATLTRDRQKKLFDQGHTTEQAYDNARLEVAALTAQQAAVLADIRSIRVDLDRSYLRAPFDGEVGNRALDVGAVVNAGTLVMNVLETSIARARIGLAPEAARALLTGAEYQLSYAGQQVEAKLVTARPDLDRTTRTRSMLFDLQLPIGAAYGDLITLNMAETLSARGFWLPVKALQEGPRGMWLVYWVDDTNTEQDLKNSVVESLHISDDRAYVAGDIPSGAQIVVGGLHRVVAGQSVKLGTPSDSR